MDHDTAAPPHCRPRADRPPPHPHGPTAARRRRRIGAAASVLPVLLLAGCAAGPAADPTLRIVSASYRTHDRSVPCNVTTKVAAACDGQPACTVTAGSALCPMGDPAPGQPKRLAVAYTCGGAAMPAAEADDGRPLALACPRR